MSINAIGSMDAANSLNSFQQIEQQQKDNTELQVEQSNTAQQTENSSAAVASKVSGLSNQTQVTSDDEDSDQALINKAKAGSTLTQSEMSRLKELDPALYARLQAREELRNQSKYDQVELSAEAIRLSRAGALLPPPALPNTTIAK